MVREQFRPGVAAILVLSMVAAPLVAADATQPDRPTPADSYLVTPAPDTPPADPATPVRHGGGGSPVNGLLEAVGDLLGTG